MSFFRSLVDRLRPAPPTPVAPTRVFSPDRKHAVTRPPSLATVERVAALTGHFAFLWQAVAGALIPGATTEDAELAYREAVLARGLTAAFPGYRAFPRDITFSVGNEVINTLPSTRRLQSGDLVKVQHGLRTGTAAFAYQAWTHVVGEAQTSLQPLLASARAALAAGVSVALVGSHVGEISFAINDVLARAGHWPSEHYVGHGIGTSLHMDPQIPGTAPPDIGITPVLAEHTLLSVVVLAHAARPQLRVAADGWNVLTVDGSSSVLFSHMVRVTADGPVILTPEVNAIGGPT